MDIKRNEIAQRTFASLIVLVITIISVFVSYHFLSDKPKEKSVNVAPQIDIKQVTKEVDSRKTELDKLKSMNSLDIYPKGLVTPQSLIDACQLGSVEQNRCNLEISNITRKIISSGIIDHAKLYIKAGVSINNSPFKPITQYDSIWFFFDNIDLSGHLLRSKAIYNGVSEDGFTELVFDLSSLPITNKLPYSDSNPFNLKDVLKQINTDQNHFMSSFISTQGFGKIENLIIYYDGNGKLDIIGN